MNRKPRFEDLLLERRTRQQALWDSLSLLNPEEWETPLGGKETARAMLAARVEDNLRVLRAVEAAAVGLNESGEVAASESRWQGDESPEQLLERAVATSAELDAMLAGLDNLQWQRKIRDASGVTSIAGLVESLNASYSASELIVEKYLGSYERLGKEGLISWLFSAYKALMDSVAGLREEEIMGPAWCGHWNTYQVLLHVWSWQEVALREARRWQESSHAPEVVTFSDIDAYNEYLVEQYEGKDMIDVVDGIVTAYRQTTQFIQHCEPELLQKANVLPWSYRGERDTLCGMLFTIYRHAWEHAWEIFAYREGA